MLNIDLDYNSKEIQVFYVKIKNKIRKIIYFHIYNLNNNFNNLKYEIYERNMSNIKLISGNIGTSKWYSKKYIEFKKKIKEQSIMSFEEYLFKNKFI